MKFLVTCPCTKYEKDHDNTDKFLLWYCRCGHLMANHDIVPGKRPGGCKDSIDPDDNHMEAP